MGPVGTWSLVDKRTVGHTEGIFTQREAWKLGRKIAAALKQDRKEWTRKVEKPSCWSWRRGTSKRLTGS